MTYIVKTCIKYDYGVTILHYGEQFRVPYSSSLGILRYLRYLRKFTCKFTCKKRVPYICTTLVRMCGIFTRKIEIF